MSILVKGIEMPHGEDEGIMLAIYDGKAYHIGTKQEHDAVEVPPHGRLIDEDVLMEMAEKEEGIYVGRWRKNFYSMGEIFDAIRHTPTVIEAEEGET